MISLYYPTTKTFENSPYDAKQNEIELQWNTNIEHIFSWKKAWGWKHGKVDN